MYLYGAGGHAKVIADALTLNGCEIEGLVDDNPDLATFMGKPVVHEVDDSMRSLVVSVGDNRLRHLIVDRLGSRDFPVVIHPKAIVSPSAKIGEGTVIMAGAVVQADAVIGRHCIINTSATVDHDCVVEDYVHISPGVSLCGGVRVDEGAHVGARAVVVPGRRIGRWSTVCAGSVVSKDIPACCVAAGNPARSIKSVEDYEDYKKSKSDMKERILLCLAHMSGKEMFYIEDAFKDNWVVPLGPNVNVFEADLLDYVKSADSTAMHIDEDGITRWPQAGWAKTSEKRVVALSTGTAAVHLSLLALGVKPGDEVLCQSFTFCASCNPIHYLGATPVFIDSEPMTWNLDPELLDRAIADRVAVTGRKPKAVVVVHLFGMPAKMNEILEVCRKHDIPLIEDAAEGLGSRYCGRVCGSFGEYGILSFNGNKIITTSGGGALICPDDEARREVMFYATQARESYPYYQHEHIGYNYRMSNICAGIGRGQMTILDEHVAHHRHVAELYKELFKDVEGITVHDNPSEDFESNFWLCTITVDPQLRVKGQELAYTKVIDKAVGGAAGVTHTATEIHTDVEPNANVEALRMILDAEGIESRPLWKPMHLQPVYADAPSYLNGVSEGLFKVGLCLPSGPWVTDKHVRQIVDVIKNSIIR